MTNKHMKRCITSLVTWEIQIKITMRYWFIPTKMAKIKKYQLTIPRVGEEVEQLKLICCWSECKVLQSLWKAIGHILVKLNLYPL